MTDSHLPILYSSVRSPHCLKVSMVLHEKAVPFDRVEVDLPARQQKTPAYLAINPLGQVPAYRDDQGVHIDSLVIMRHLDERHKSPRLFPSEPDRLAEVLRWIDLSSGPFRDVSHHLYWQLLEPPATGPDGAEVERLTEQGRGLLRVLDAALAAGNGWLAGELTAADISVFAWVHGYRRFGEIFAIEDGTALPHVRAWLERLASRPSFLASHGVAGRPFPPAAGPVS
jgi:glutathione S-transferase